jgi:hypothetical protein
MSLCKRIERLEAQQRQGSVVVPPYQSPMPGEGYWAEFISILRTEQYGPLIVEMFDLPVEIMDHAVP